MAAELSINNQKTEAQQEMADHWQANGGKWSTEHLEARVAAGELLAVEIADSRIGADPAKLDFLGVQYVPVDALNFEASLRELVSLAINRDPYGIQVVPRSEN